MAEQCAAGVVDHVEDGVEHLRVGVVRVRDVQFPSLLPVETEQEVDLGAVGFGRRPRAKDAVVAAVECDDEVVLGKSVGVELLGPMR